jgi:hypothetical protein
MSRATQVASKLEGQTAIREQLERILVSHDFSSSKKYPALLRYVVEETLAGRAEQLKERSIGVAVFGRDPDYDTNQDPVVRTVAAEVRKRLKLYYLGASEDPVQIDLLPGSYIPEFSSPVIVSLPLLPVEVSRGRVASSFRARYVLGLLAVLAVVSSVVSLWRPTTAQDRFWKPLLEARSPAVICVSATQRGQISPAGLAAATDSLRASDAGSPLFTVMPVSDVRALIDIIGFLHAKGKSFDLRTVSFTNLRDLRYRPVIVIGAFNNSWTRQLIDGLRFSFRRDEATDTSWIFDSNNPDSRKWQIVDTTAATKAPEDYGVIGRFRHPLTEEIVIVVAGLTHFGTAAAGEFVSRAQSMEELEGRLGRDWDRKNLEIVTATKLMRSDAGPAHIVATHVW